MVWKYLLVIALFGTAVFVGDCNAACFYQNAKGSVNGNSKGCFFNGVMHAFGSSWRTWNCLNCDCLPNGFIGCCTIGGDYTYNKEECVALYDTYNCLLKVVRRDNPDVICKPTLLG
ncbi:beta-microseminoprotein-like [Dendropsophus ebraccatus]|uniref:beta-microseminoprotein-like n=1 Tax=Dendropsophus ebraccatus TaxID=150705 RepID=UPI003831D503